MVSAGLGALGDNGGSTWTHLPSVTSPLLGGANDALCVDEDQRGSDRPDTNCDTGAVERGVRPPTPIFIDGFRQGHALAWSDVVGEGA